MKYILLIGIFFMSSCAIQGEKFRLQTRMNHWNTLINEQEMQLFADNKTNELGLILDQKEHNPEFADQLRQLRVNEAIMSFDGVQTAHFFYNTLLKDLVKFSYKEFIYSLKSEEQYLFMSQSTYKTDDFTSSAKIIQNATKIYGMKNFTKDQVLSYYRNVSMPQVMHVLAYDILAFMAKYQMLNIFLSGNISQASELFTFLNNSQHSSKISLRKQAEQDLKIWDHLKKRSFLNVSNQELLTFIFYTVLPEMDQNVRNQTIENIRSRYKEQQ
ncbi:MAG: hypothetical protein ACRCTJ_01225 [Brevinema sp.]